MTTSALHEDGLLPHERAQILNDPFVTGIRELLNLAWTYDLDDQVAQCLIEGFKQPQIHEHNRFVNHLLVKYLLYPEWERQPRSVDDLLNLLFLTGHVEYIDMTADDDVIDLTADDDVVDLTADEDMVDLTADDDVIDLTVDDDVIDQAADEDVLYIRREFCTPPPPYSP